MNDTQLTHRQVKILGLLAPKPLKRQQIESLLQKQISKITLIRDLNSLIKKRLISATGNGRGTTYHSVEKPILRTIDKEEYFKEGSYLRNFARTNFDFEVFGKLKDLFSQKEMKNLAGKIKRFDKQEKEVNPTIFKRELERFTVEFSWKSSKIEGNTYTLLETEALIKHAQEATGHSKYEAIMLLNHKKAIDFILENRNSFKRLTLEKVLNLHNILTTDLEIDQGIRNGSVGISGTNYVPLAKSNDLKKALGETIRTINRSDFPLEKALIASSMIAYIQAFFDGNKRTARTLANAILLSNNCYPLSYRDLKEVDYIESLIIFYEQGSLQGLKEIIINQLWFSQENYFRL